MPNLRYQRGASYERMIANSLTELGWYAVRSAASKGLFDVIAYPVADGLPAVSLLIQSKSLREPITAEAWLKRPGVQKELKPFGDFNTTVPHVKLLAVVQPGSSPVEEKKGKKTRATKGKKKVGNLPLRVTLFHVYDYTADGQEHRRKFKRIHIEGVSK